MSSLIDEDSKWWNMELIDNLFPPNEAQKKKNPFLLVYYLKLILLFLAFVH